MELADRVRDKLERMIHHLEDKLKYAKEEHQCSHIRDHQGCWARLWIRAPQACCDPQSAVD